jgi:hypothetical protein
MKVLIRGPVLTRSGYGEHVRFILRSLKEKSNLDLYVVPLGWGQTGWLISDATDKDWIDALIGKTQAYISTGNAQFDVSIQVSIPNEWEKLAPVNIGVTAGIETTRCAPVWIEKANIMDKVIVPSEHSKTVFEKTVYDAVVKETGEELVFKCKTPVDVISYPVKTFEDIDLNLDLETDFNFINVAQWGPRKNLENCIRWFVEEFYDNEKVGLVLKSNLVKNCLMDREALRGVIKNSLEGLHESFTKNRKCKIYLLHGDFSDKEMHQLYRHPKIKALVSTSHGEGFGLPMFEAAYEGLPVAVPGWGGYLDFLTMPVKGKKTRKEMFVNVDFSLQNVQSHAVWKDVIPADSKWCYATEYSFKGALAEIYKDYGRFKKRANKLKKYLANELSEQNQYERVLSSLSEFFVDDEWSTALDKIQIL